MKNSVLVEAVTDESGTEYRVKAIIEGTALHSDWTTSEARAEESAAAIRAALPPTGGVQGDAAREVTDAERLAFLHSSNQDPEGYEYGVCRVKVTDGNVSYLWTASNHSDIDSIILKQRGCAHRFAIFNKNPNQRCMDCGLYQSVHEAAASASQHAGGGE
jgi:hypothetical protein